MRTSQSLLKGSARHRHREGINRFVSEFYKSLNAFSEISWDGALTLARCALFPNGTEDPMPSSTQNQERSVMILKSLHIMSRHDARNWKGALTLASLEIRPTAQVLGTLLSMLHHNQRWVESLQAHSWIAARGIMTVWKGVSPDQRSHRPNTIVSIGTPQRRVRRKDRWLHDRKMKSYPFHSRSISKVASQLVPTGRTFDDAVQEHLSAQRGSNVMLALQRLCVSGFETRRSE